MTSEQQSEAQAESSAATKLPHLGVLSQVANEALDAQECPSPTVEMQRCMSTGFSPAKDYVVLVEGRQLKTPGLEALSCSLEEAMPTLIANSFEVECVRRHDTKLLGFDLFYHQRLQLVEVSKVHQEGCIASWNSANPTAKVRRGCFILRANNVDFRPKAAQDVTTAFAPHHRMTLLMSAPPPNHG
mmetsp:Transcript_44963/g.101177  ORF Transcript_44963/g.101177 Transcript_44963/m.101177 type:complete len:186 (+) Transcript_44963:163-720(+)